MNFESILNKLSTDLKGIDTAPISDPYQSYLYSYHEASYRFLLTFLHVRNEQLLLA